MTFTKNNINNKQLWDYLLKNALPISYRQEKGCLVNVYDRTETIKNLQAKINRHKRDARYNKFSPIWEKHIEILKALK